MHKYISFGIYVLIGLEILFVFTLYQMADGLLASFSVLTSRENLTKALLIFAATMILGAVMIIFGKRK